MNVKIAPSLLAGDFARLGEEVKRAEDAGADVLHLDVMDGHFVPNITIGPPVVESIRAITKLPLDCHLMIMEPEKHVESFADAGADTITFHAEAVAEEYARKYVEHGWRMELPCAKLYNQSRLDETIAKIRGKGKRVGIAINPGSLAESLTVMDQVDMVLVMSVWPGFGGQKFIPDVLPKIERVRKMSATVDIEVDGGIGTGNIREAAGAGANWIVAGTATFRSDDMAGVIRELRRIAEDALKEKHGV